MIYLLSVAFYLKIKKKFKKKNQRVFLINRLMMFEMMNNLM